VAAHPPEALTLASKWSKEKKRRSTSLIVSRVYKDGTTKRTSR
jgi:hypothetical protein